MNDVLAAASVTLLNIYTRPTASTTPQARCQGGAPCPVAPRPPALPRPRGPPSLSRPARLLQTHNGVVDKPTLHPTPHRTKHHLLPNNDDDDMASNNPSPRWLEEEATETLMDPEEGLEEGGGGAHEAHDATAAPAGARTTPPPTKAGSGRKKQTRRAAGRASPQQAEEEDEQAERKRRITKPFFAILSTIIVLLSLVSVAYNLYLIIEKDGTTTSILPRVYRGFAIVLAFAAILTEASVKWWKKLCPVLSYLFVRGFFYCLIAVLSLEDFNARDDNVVGFVFLGFGLFYVALALMCVQRHVEIM